MIIDHCVWLGPRQSRQEFGTNSCTPWEQRQSALHMLKARNGTQTRLPSYSTTVDTSCYYSSIAGMLAFRTWDQNQNITAWDTDVWRCVSCTTLQRLRINKPSSTHRLKRTRDTKQVHQISNQGTKWCDSRCGRTSYPCGTTVTPIQ